jgi:hypothetical protein
MARSVASLAPAPRSTHSLPALVFASQSPCSGCQTVANSPALCAICPRLVKKIKYYLFGIDKKEIM